jgi:hypothetical protein
VRESLPRTSCNSFCKSNHKSSIYRTPRTVWNCKNYNYWSINQIWSIPRINLSKSKMWYKKPLRTHLNLTRTQSWPLFPLLMKRRRPWSTILASKTCSSKPTSFAIISSNCKNLKVSLNQWAIQRNGRPQWPHIKSWSTHQQFYLSCWAIISRRKTSSQWLMVLQSISFWSETQCTNIARRQKSDSSPTPASPTSSSSLLHVQKAKHTLIVS